MDEETFAKGPSGLCGLCTDRHMCFHTGRQTKHQTDRQAISQAGRQANNCLSVRQAGREANKKACRQTAIKLVGNNYNAMRDKQLRQSPALAGTVTNPS